ncbi:MAG: haloacid dehalogenase type II [Chloroflexi bacterium]|nr:haloacid dehalogenase type II [Chloroflexota bacterium]
MARVIVFDVIETMLNLRALDAPFERVFGDGSVRQQWFSQMLQLALVATITDAYQDFGAIGRAALEMVAAQRGTTLADEQRTQILGGVRTLPPHPDVKDGLAQLRAAGFRLASLTNSAAQTAEAQLNHAGLRSYFEQVLSVDAVRKFKPAAEVYHHAARMLGVEPSEIRLVAAHDWDVFGALRAGCAAAFVARDGMVLNPLAQPPDVIGKDVREVAQQIIAVERTGT